MYGTFIKSIEQLKERFPLIYKQCSTGRYPISNDRLVYDNEIMKFDTTVHFHCDFVRELLKVPEKRSSIQRNPRVALVVGEGNIASLLPELERISDAVIFVDFDGKVLEHISYLLKCLKESNSIDDFKEKYRKNCPEKDPDFHLKSWGTLTEKYCFLSSEERFLRCKRATEKLSYGFSGLNFSDENQMMNFSEYLKQNKLEVVYANFTNVHQYVLDLMPKTQYSKLIENFFWHKDGLEKGYVQFSFNGSSVLDVNSGTASGYCKRVRSHLGLELFPFFTYPDFSSSLSLHENPYNIYSELNIQESCVLSENVSQFIDLSSL